MYISFIYFFIPLFNRHKILLNTNIIYQNKTNNNDASMIPKRQLPKNNPLFRPIPNKPI